MNVQPLKLHLKTTLLVSAITLTIMLALLIVISARLADVLHEEEKNLTEVEVRNLAEHLGTLTETPDAGEWQDAVSLVRKSRLDVINMQVWELVGDNFIPMLSTNNDAQAIPTETAVKLRQNQMDRLEPKHLFDTQDSVFRIYAPIVRAGKVTGALEISDHLDNLPTVLLRSLSAVFWLAMLAVALIAAAVFILFRDFFYRPLEKILAAITRAKAGELNTQAPLHKSDELGRLAQEFNSMMEQIHMMTMERAQQQDNLRTRVNEATAQLTERNAQLAVTNLELWRTTRQLTQLERLAAAGQTAAQFAHEVGTPLNLISCHAELLQTEVRGETVAIRERTEIIIEQIERIERIVRGMLDRTRIEAVRLTPLDFNELLRKIVETTMPLLEERKVALQLALAPSLPLIAGNADRLQQVFINLINNALDAMPEGGTLTLTTKIAEGNHIFIEVGDTGGGMSAEVQAHIFDPLYTTKARGKGTGLGLVIVHQVMQEHGGSVAVTSESAQGARFRLSFPLLVDAAKGQPV